MRTNIWVIVVFLVGSLSLVTDVPVRADELSDYAQMEQVWQRLYSAGKYPESEKLAVEMLDISRRSFPNFVFVDYSRVGLSRAALAKYPEAVEYLTKALELGQNFRPQNEAQRRGLIDAIGNTATSLGLCNYHMAKYDESKNWLERAVTWYEQFPNEMLHAQAVSLLASSYWKMGDKAKAHETYRKADTLLRPLIAQETRPGQAMYHFALNQRNWAVLYKEAGRYDIAEPMLRRALQQFISSVGYNHSETATCLDTLASAYFQQGRTADAEPLFRLSIEIHEQRSGHDHPRALVAVAKLGDVYFVSRQFAEAEKLYRRTIDSLERRFGPEHPDLCSPLWMLGRCLAMDDRPVEAEPVLERSVAIGRKFFGPLNTTTAIALTWLAWGKTQVLKPEEAFRLSTEVLEIHEQNPLANWTVARCHAIRAICLWVTGKRQEGLEEQNKVIQLKEIERWQVGGGEAEKAIQFAGNLSDYSLLVGWYVELGELEQAFQTIDTMKARTFLDELESRGSDPLAGLPPEKKAEIQQRETELRTALTAAEQRLESLPDPGVKPGPELVAQRRAASRDVLHARDELYQYLAEVRRSSPAYQQLMTRDRQAVSLATIQKSLLEPDDLLLVYQIGNKQSHVMTVRRDQAAVHELKIDESLAKSLQVAAGPLTQEALMKILINSPESVVPALSNPAHANSKNVELAALWRLLLPAAERTALVSGKIKHLVVVPDGPLGLLPFETLIVSGDAQPQYLLDVGPPIAYAPSASVLMNLVGRKTPDAKALEPVLTLGDAVYQAVAPDTASSQDRRLAQIRTARDRFRAGLAPLPFTGWEASWVQEIFSKAGIAAKKLTRAEATEAAIRRETPGREIVHLACHGMADQSYGNFFGSLAVTPGKGNDPRDDGFLTMSEIYDLNLNGCELAILSACQTNYGPQQWGEGVWALSRGFLVAGARRVIASNWVVDDEAGATLVSHFTSFVAKSGKDVSLRDYSASLHEAKKRVRKEEKWSSPFYWGSLVLMGPK